MNEFLKNLRSGKTQSQSTSPSRKGDYHSNERRSGGDRRGNPQRKKSSSQSKGGGSDVMGDVLPNIQLLLESIAESNRKMALARERRADAEERKADIFEGLVVSLRDFLESDTVRNLTESGMRMARPFTEAKPAPPKKIPPDERDRIVKLIRSMRKSGSTYDQIAGYLDEQQIPTFSNKGRWHAQTIHRICQKK